ncbi:myeloid leukemia factor 1 isoform X1 [Gymnodraco acuticeps]|uniref:Myeloid leukemia factor 1 isoform X1 n=1 Tax=Gymnodraco acuticeps TaxID=8218 RepID=A0A6P8V799_GYMAC|nr:myeloid leukemia factor 1 isoform X1 [Gymnodraco acuticeps]
MFNSNHREFDEDPFFSDRDPFRAHTDHMRQMMRSFSEPFGGNVMPSIMDGRNQGRGMAEHPTSSVALRDEHRDISRSLLPFGSFDSTGTTMNPFGMFDNVMSNMKSRMEEMHRNFENTSTDSNSHSFSSSSVMTYSKVGNEPPKVFQASSSTRQAPGGIKETRKAVKDSESGVEQMTIGHHIQDRGHVVEKKFNKKTGNKEFNQDFQNLDESEAETFDDEWQQEVSKFHTSGPMSRQEEPRLRGAHRAALTGSEQELSDQPKAKAEGKSCMKGSGSTKQ